jgi:precorrin-6B methylase 2
VLDVGCGAAVHGMVARRTGAHVTGLEKDPELAERAKRVLDRVFCLDPSDSVAVAGALGEARFDLILVAGMLERSESPGELLRSFGEYLEPEGRLVWSVRNREAWTVRLGLQHPELGYDRGATTHMYSRRETTDFVRHSGLELLSVEQNPMLLKALRAALGEQFYLSLKHDEELGTGFRDLSAYQMYLELIRPAEVALAQLSPELLAFQNVVVARRPPVPGPLSLTVGMLTMDEEPSVERMIEGIRQSAPDAAIVCVDSSVKDQTPVIAERMGARVVRQLPPRGHGPAMERLMYEAAAQSEALIYLDCDFTYPLEMIGTIRRILESGADVVNAARIRSRPAAMPVSNYIANKAFVWCARLLDGVPISDLHSGMRGYRSSVIRSFSFDGEGDALPIDTLLWPARSGYRVIEIPIDYQERVGASKLRKLAGTFWTFIRLGKSVNVGTRRADTYERWESPEGP